jgi:hypothetical protein
MHFERPVTKKMKAAAEAERKARLEAEYRAAIERQRAEQQARVEKARIEWENLLRSLPGELKRIEEIVTNELIPEWEQSANAPIDWEQLGEPICSVQWVLHYNVYEKFEDFIPYHYESSDGIRAGTYTERIIRERMPGSYWVSPWDPHREYFISRANSPDGPIPPVQYPYCTIAGEIDLWKEFPHDKARVDAIIQKFMGDQEYYRARVEEAQAALAGTARDRVKYLLSRQEADRVRNNLQKAWSILNPNKSKDLFWEDLLQVLL